MAILSKTRSYFEDVIRRHHHGNSSNVITFRRYDCDSRVAGHDSSIELHVDDGLHFDDVIMMLVLMVVIMALKCMMMI